MLLMGYLILRGKRGPYPISRRGLASNGKMMVSKEQKNVREHTVFWILMVYSSPNIRPMATIDKGVLQGQPSSKSGF